MSFPPEVSQEQEKALYQRFGGLFFNIAGIWILLDYEGLSSIKLLSLEILVWAFADAFVFLWRGESWLFGCVVFDLFAAAYLGYSSWCLGEKFAFDPVPHNWAAFVFIFGATLFHARLFIRAAVHFMEKEETDENNEKGEIWLFGSAVFDLLVATYLGYSAWCLGEQFKTNPVSPNWAAFVFISGAAIFHALLFFRAVVLFLVERKKKSYAVDEKAPILPV